MQISKKNLAVIFTILVVQVLASSNTMAEEKKSLTLEATVKKQEVTLQTIRDVRLDLKRVKGAASDIFDEVTREPMDFSTAPNVVGGSVIINPITIRETSVLEPRTKWIENSIAKMGPIIELLRADVDSIGKDDASYAFSEQSQKTLDGLTQDWKSMVKEMFSQYQSLKAALTQKPYNNVAIASRSRSIFLKAKALEKTRRQAERLFKKEIKTRKKEEKRRKKELKQKGN